MLAGFLAGAFVFGMGILVGASIALSFVKKEQT